jgi:hypothetical protein
MHLKMKNSGRLLLLILAIPVIVFYSCDKKVTSDSSPKGMAEFSFSLSNQVKGANSGTADSGMVSYH